jgi:hypothetical protein
VDASQFAVFKADSKYVIGVTASGDEHLLLPDRISLKELLGSVPGLMRVSRSVLVARRYVELVTGPRDERCVHAAGKQYKLSRDELPERFEAAAIENGELCAPKPWDRGRAQLTRDLKNGLFIVFRVEQKRVIAVTASREKWRLPVKVRLTDLEQTVPGLMRVNRSVLVARTQVEYVTGSRDERCVRAFGMEYSLSREIDPMTFRIAASENNSKRSTKFRAPRLQPGHHGLPVIAHQMSSHAIGI